MDQSAKMRKLGNSLFTTLNDNLAPVLFEKRSREALRNYKLALDFARTPGDKGSCHKNLSAAYRKIASRKRSLSEVRRYVSSPYALDSARKINQRAMCCAEAANLDICHTGEPARWGVCAQ